MEVKKYVIDLSLSDRLEELKDSFFDDIAFVKYSDHKAVVETMQNKIDELEKFKKETLVRFKNDCVNIYVSKYGQDRSDMIDYMNSLDDDEYFDYMCGETSTEDYVDEEISNWDI